MSGLTLGGDFPLGGLASTASCAHLYTYLFWNSRRFIERKGQE